MCLWGEERGCLYTCILWRHQLYLRQSCAQDLRAVSSKGASIDISCKSGKGKVFICVFVFSLSGKGGRISSGSSLSRYVVKNIALQKVDDSNPREAILKFAQVSCREIP